MWKKVESEQSLLQEIIPSHCHFQKSEALLSVVSVLRKKRTAK